MLLLYLLTLPSPELQRPPLDGAVWGRHSGLKVKELLQKDTFFVGFRMFSSSHLESCKLADLNIDFLQKNKCPKLTYIGHRQKRGILQKTAEGFLQSEKSENVFFSESSFNIPNLILPKDL